MHSILIKTSTLLALSTIGTISSGFTAPAIAQTQQILGQCVQELRQQGFYNTNAADRCEKLLQTQRPAQTLGQCIADLRQQGFYNSQAADRCQRLLSAQSENQGQNQPARNPGMPVITPGGSPQAIADCMKKLMYERKPVCTRSRCAALDSPANNANRNFGGWQWQTVRTNISESAAAQACQNAR